MTTTSRYFAGALALLAVQGCVLRWFGQPLIAASGHILLWVGNPLSPDTSQQLTDWYSFSHIIHGILFFWLLRWLAPRLPVRLRFLLAMGVEIGWEIVENSPAVIRHYRQQALAVGYAGDSVLNSLSDTLMMSAGFWLALRIPGRWALGVTLAFELFTAVMIRDNLTLNVINLIAPAGWPPIRAIHDWQAGYRASV